MRFSRRILFWAPLLLGNSIALYGLFCSDHPSLFSMAGISLWVAVWWLSEVVEISVASVIPFIFIPLYGIGSAKEIAAQYMDPVIFLFLGGFVLSLGIEKWGLHNRLAFALLARFAKTPVHVLGSIMMVAFLLSMWISNTATVLMLLAATQAMVHPWTESKGHSGFAAAILLGLAFAASIGGMATPVGTPTNLIFLGFYHEQVSPHRQIGFLDWFMVGFPIAVFLLVIAFLILKKRIPASFSSSFKGDLRPAFYEQYRSLGPMSFQEKSMLGVFGVTSLLWITRSPFHAGIIDFPGWGSFFPHTDYLHDGLVAMLMGFLLFLIPAGKDHSLLDKDDLKRIPLEIILLFGGGFALAKGFDISGLGSFLAGSLAFLNDFPSLAVVLIVVAMVTFISEFASNVASIQLTLPVLAALSVKLNIDPLLLMWPATLAASLGFVLPVATAPNTIVFGTGQVSTRHFLKSGFWLDVLGILLVGLFCWLFL